ncbi:MAG: hypothetical protein QXS21_00960 [Thermoproteota archaeon]|nr:hypothetical protein [Candidatus Brockarchaeota archaeon]MBO3768332.1 hypothetical protein [Candidatus Brockarchaeota archaeon]
MKLKNKELEWLIFIWVPLWAIMSYEDIKDREVSIIFLAIFFVSSLAFVFIKGILVRNTLEYLLSILEVTLVSGIQLILGCIGFADFIFSLAIVQLVSIGIFRVRLILGFFPTNLQFDTGLVEPIYVNMCTVLLRIDFLKKMQNITDKRLVRIIAFSLPFAWIFAVIFPKVKTKKPDVPFIPLFGMLVLITSLAHIIIL